MQSPPVHYCPDCDCYPCVCVADAIDPDGADVRKSVARVGHLVSRTTPLRAMALLDALQDRPDSVSNAWAAKTYRARRREG